METIAQIATPQGIGGISIIKVSGNLAIDMVNKIFLGKNLNSVKSHTINYGFIVEDNLKIDEVLVSVMRTPNSFTGEDVVEINCHGGILITKKILKLLIKNGVKLADRGEFTKRAFLNGKKTFEETLNTFDLIHAQTDEALDLAISSLNTPSRKLIENLREKLLNIVSTIEVNIDYPEYEDIKEIKHSDLKKDIDTFISDVENIIRNTKSGEIIKNGIKTAILGKPNVGKSSILNYLSKNDKAIVSTFAGTTRDMIENEVILGRIRLNLVDTAGIRSSSDEIEQIGVKKSLQQIENSDLILFVLDGSSKITLEELNLIDKIRDKNFLIIINKADKDLVINLDDIDVKDNLIIKMSTIEMFGDVELEMKIEKIFDLINVDNFKHIQIVDLENMLKLESILKNMMYVKDSLNNGVFLDLLLIDLKDSLFALGDMLGLNPKEDYLNEMFSRFCLGK